MAENSGIQWTNHTFNPWRGCTKVSAGCANCYADAMSGRNPKVLGVWGPNGTRVVAAEGQWKLPLKWDRAAKAAGRRDRVFCASLADVFEDWKGGLTASGAPCHVWTDGKAWKVDEYNSAAVLTENNPGFRPLRLDDVRQRLFDLIDQTPNLDWLLLTKRPENIARMMPKRFEFDPAASSELACAVETEVAHRNVWIGTSVEDQKTADERIPHLLRVPAAVRFLSMEPMLGPVDLKMWDPLHPKSDGQWMASVEGVGVTDMNRAGPTGIGWVICGGESGPDARPMHPAWARSLRDQCQAAGVPFFFKQWGEWCPSGQVGCTAGPGIELRDLALDGRTLTGHWAGCDSWAAVCRVGKKAAGRLLDGRQWDEYPDAGRPT